VLHSAGWRRQRERSLRLAWALWAAVFSCAHPQWLPLPPTAAYDGLEFGRAPKGDALWPASDGVWIVASVLTLVAAVLFSGSFIRNPSLPGVSDAMAGQIPSGVFKATRHPMMWGFALWGIAHILVAPRIDNFIFAGSLVFLALVGSKAQEIKKRKLMGAQWDAWLRRTHFAIHPVALFKVGIGPWLAGIFLWAAATWAHPYWNVAGAGLFRWFSF